MRLGELRWSKKENAGFKEVIRVLWFVSLMLEFDFVFLELCTTTKYS